LLIKVLSIEILTIKILPDNSDRIGIALIEESSTRTMSKELLMLTKMMIIVTVTRITTIVSKILR